MSDDAMHWNPMGYTQDYADWCGAWVINNAGPARKKCGNAARHDLSGILYLCDKHHRMIEKEISARVVEKQDQVNEGLRQQLREIDEADEARWRDRLSYEAHLRNAQVVYFIRCDNFMKIGMSVDPERRLKVIRTSGGSMFPTSMDVSHAALVATEPGGRWREAELHAKFAHLRHTGEWFTEAPELTEYVEDLIA